jgi:hypothetical protein
MSAARPVVRLAWKNVDLDAVSLVGTDTLLSFEGPCPAAR